MLKDLVKQSWMSIEDIITQASNEYDIGYTAAEPIRAEFEEETKLFNYQKKNKDKIWDSTLFNVHSAMMAREYVDKPTSKFEGTYGQMNIVNNLNTTLDIDFNDSYMENLIYDWKHDKFLRWLGITIRNGWDWENKRPTFDLIDPRLAILDPDWNYRNWDYSYFGFEKVEYLNTLEWDDFENIENIIQYSSGGNAKDLKDKDQQNAKISGSQSINRNNPAVEVYYHFGIFNWVRALVLLANSRTEVIRVKIYKENKKILAFDDILAITYWRPRKNNVYGDRMPRYVGDVQVVKSLLANLRLDKIKAELYPMYIRNTRLISNKEDLEFGFNKIIDANPLEWESIANAIAPVPRDLRTDQSYTLDANLDKQLEASTSIGKVAQWTTPERREAATTNKLVQDSTDINLAFTAKIDAIGYERLIKVWYEGYKIEFKEWDKKLVYIQTWFGSMPRELRKKDFLTDIALKIKIETVVEINEKKQTDRLAYGQLIGFLQSIPNRPESAQLNTMRNYARSMNLSEENIDIEIPMTAQEIIAQENAWLLLDWENLQVESSYDPDTHLLMVKSLSWLDNVAAYRYGLLKLKKIQGEQKEQQPEDNGVSNTLAAQAWAAVSNEANAVSNTL